MKVLLDTNILIHREAAKIIRSDIGILFRWLDRLHCEKCVHPVSVEEIRKHADKGLVRTFETKLESYVILKTTAPDDPAIATLRTRLDRNRNDSIDTTLLNEVVCDRVDFLVTEDRNVHRKARDVSAALRVFTIDGFLEKVTAENPSLADYSVLSVRKEYFGNVDIADPFFDSFREDYPEFDSWFNRKSEESAYLCTDDAGRVIAFLYLKVEDANEDYSDISPEFQPERRLKIGTFKVVSNGYKLGERFIKIVFDNAIIQNVESIYVTVYENGDKTRLVELLRDWGFVRFGQKENSKGLEAVYCRPCTPEHARQAKTPRLSYPYAKGSNKKFLVPIYPEYHTELFPDSILRTESPDDFVESTPNRNAISKVYISRSIERGLSPGDILVFYRTASGGSAWYTSVATTLGVVQSIITDVSSEEHFLALCRKRSVFSDEELREHWNYNPRSRPFVVNFLYLYSFPKRMNRKALVETGVLGQDPPRGFVPLSDEQFEKLLGGSHVQRTLVVD